MSSFINPLALAARGLALTALIGATILVAPLVVLAQTAAPTVAEAPANTGMATVELRITNLHASLGITPAEEAGWVAVARTMRENETALEKLIATQVAPQNMSAMDNMQSYTAFAQQNLDALKTLTAAFGTLYHAMPVDQQKVADQVFRDFGRPAAAKN